jgi:hypothetical protein
LSYTSENRRLLGDPGRPRLSCRRSSSSRGQVSRRGQQSRALARGCAGSVRCSGQMVAVRYRAGNSALRFAFALPAGKKPCTSRNRPARGHRRAPRLANGNHTQLRADSLTPLEGTRMHKSRETGTGSFDTRHCQAQFVPSGGSLCDRSRAAVCCSHLASHLAEYLAELATYERRAGPKRFPDSPPVAPQ